jgi:predicted kinase
VSVVVAADLDRTLIYSRAAIDAAHPPGTVPPLLCVETLDGNPLSYMTVRAAALLEGLRAISVLVPTTTRTLAQYQRVHLPGGRAPFAVVSNGGHLVIDGVVDVAWRRAVERRVAGEGAALPEIVLGLDRRATGSWVLNRKVADNLFCYLVVDLATLPADFLAAWTAWCADRGWVVSMQGRKIYALPRELTKEAAITEVMTRSGATRLLAAGDGALDAGFLSLARRAIRPPHGELAEIGWFADHVRVATAAGVLAGEQILRWLTEQVAL